ncbi:glycosyltransferase family 4 protein [Neiella sp. HB171785]|uniref:Glycosyltransferase family 4 protein n=1 Tax=Neiella litorisoli TaxID=2771431 RepID=A0A8J6QK89_9GAMM|nr:glycosyltransferase family 4 protein [Neiella litorisoli]MBD1390744.1 glycosyltransferase family 4 protein [Neiella litorisoli]
MDKAIWLMLDSRNVGGIESHVGQLAKALHKRGYDVWVVFWKLYDSEHPLRSELQQRGVKTLLLGGSPWRFIRAVRRCKPRIVHTHGYKAGLVGRFLSWCGGASVVSSYHAGETPTGRVWLYDWLDRQSAYLCQARIAVSEQIASRLPCSAMVIDNFVQAAEPATNEIAGDQQIAFVGRLSVEKAPERILKIAEQLPQQTFHLYGDGPLLSDLQSKAPDNVVFHGKVDDMSQCWPAIELLLIPSRAEGLPMVALEAMAHGASVIASPLGGLPSLLKDVDGCCLIDGDNTYGWAAAIDDYQQLSESQKQPLAEQAKAKVERAYSTTAILPLFESIYAKVSRT